MKKKKYEVWNPSNPCRCYLQHKSLNCYLYCPQIKKSHLKYLNRKQLGITPSLSFIELNRTHYETHTYQWLNSNCITKATTISIPIIHHSTLTKEDTFEDVMTKSIEIDQIKTEGPKDEPNEIDKKVKSKKKQAHNSPTINKFLEESKFEIETDEYINDVNNDTDINDDIFDMSCKIAKIDGAKFNEEYAQMVAISVKEAKAAIEVKKLYMSGLHKCGSCGRAFKTKENLKVHSRMHDKVSFNIRVLNFVLILGAREVAQFRFQRNLSLEDF